MSDSVEVDLQGSDIVQQRLPVGELDAVDKDFWVCDIALEDRGPSRSVVRIQDLRHLDEKGVIFVTVDQCRPPGSRGSADLPEVGAEVKNTFAAEVDLVQERVTVGAESGGALVAKSQRLVMVAGCDVVLARAGVAHTKRFQDQALERRLDRRNLDLLQRCLHISTGSDAVSATPTV